jgi:hypothetical protein
MLQRNHCLFLGLFDLSWRNLLQSNLLTRKETYLGVKEIQQDFAQD